MGIPSHSTDYDVIGAGMAGLTAAARLSTQRRKVLIRARAVISACAAGYNTASLVHNDLSKRK